MDPNSKLLLYKAIHLSGLILSFVSLGALATIAVRGSERRSRFPAIGHGVGLFLILLGGFGMLAVLQKLKMIDGWPTWLIIKLVMWIGLGAAIAVFGRKPEFAKATIGACIAFGVVATIMALFKPFM